MTESIPAADRGSSGTAARIGGRVLLFAAIWLVLAGTDPGSWLVGVPAVVLAVVTAERLTRHGNPGVSPLGLLRFVPFFLWESVLGGIDVANRVLRPKMRVDPGFVQYPVRLASPSATVFFLDSISLLPGTLSADLRAGSIHVHVLDVGADSVTPLQRLERRVADLFNERLDHSDA